MRTLEKNKTALWYVEPIGMIEEVDGDGNYTGEVVANFSTPTLIKIHLYPAVGSVIEQPYGKDSNFDMMGIGSTVELSEHGLLFYEQPFADYELSYDYAIESVFKSLNVTRYGLRRRT